MLCLMFGVDISIAGFDFFKGGSMHYFEPDDGRLQVGEVHAIEFERDFVERVLKPLGAVRTVETPSKMIPFKEPVLGKRRGVKSGRGAPWS